MPHPRRLAASWLAAILLLGCTPKAGSPVAAVPEWRAERIATIGGDTGNSSFVRVRSLLFAPNGELYVVDQGDKQVKLFDSTGAFLRLLGRRGAGPAEYRDPYSVAWLHDTLALLDPGNSRIGLFGPDGKWAGTLPVQPISGGPDIRLYRTGPASFWAYGYTIVAGGAQNIFVRYTGAGPQDTLRFHRSNAPDRTITCETTDRALHFFRAPFAASDLLIPTPLGTRAFARTDDYRIIVLGAANDTLQTLTLDEPPLPISDLQWKEGLKEWEEFQASATAPKCDGDELPRPTRIPALTSLAFDPEGRLWVEVRIQDGNRYDLWADGRRIASVTGLPTSAEVDPAFLGDLVALPLPDAGEGPRVGIFRIVKAP